MPSVFNARLVATEKSGQLKTDRQAIQRELYERSIAKLRADPEQAAAAAPPLDSALIDKIVDHCKKSLDLSEFFSTTNFPGVAYGLTLWEQNLSVAPSTADYLLKIAELFSDYKLYKQSNQLYVRAIEVASGFGRSGPAEDFDLMEISSPVANNAKLGMAINAILSGEYQSDVEKLREKIYRLLSNIPEQDMKPTHRAVRDYVDRREIDDDIITPEYALLMSRLMIADGKPNDAISIISKSLSSNSGTVNDSKPITQLWHQLALAKALDQLPHRRNIIKNNEKSLIQ